MTNSETIYHFYSSLEAGNIEDLLSCYHPQISFSDPVFGELQGDQAHSMWRMLMSKMSSDIKIDVNHVFDQNGRMHCTWAADYPFGKNQRHVHNEVSSQFTFKDNRIITHHDVFDLWKWTRQALGWPGYLFGWSNIMQRKMIERNQSYLTKIMKKA